MSALRGMHKTCLVCKKSNHVAKKSNYVRVCGQTSNYVKSASVSVHS